MAGDDASNDGASLFWVAFTVDIEGFDKPFWTDTVRRPGDDPAAVATWMENLVRTDYGFTETISVLVVPARDPLPACIDDAVNDRLTASAQVFSFPDAKAYRLHLPEVPSYGSATRENLNLAAQVAEGWARKARLIDNECVTLVSRYPEKQWILCPYDTSKGKATTKVLAIINPIY